MAFGTEWWRYTIQMGFSIEYLMWDDLHIIHTVLRGKVEKGWHLGGLLFFSSLTMCYQLVWARKIHMNQTQITVFN